MNLKEVKELIAVYESDLNKLNFQTANIKDVLIKLEKTKKKLEKKEEKQAKKNAKKNSTSSLSTNGTLTPLKDINKGSGRSPKVVRIRNISKDGEESIREEVVLRESSYRLSDWDRFLIEEIKAADELLTRPELNVIFAKKAEQVGGMTEEDMIKKGSNVLHKLANKHEAVIKYPFPGRGYVYGVPDWFFAKTGELKKSYKTKLAKKAKKLGKL